MTYASPVTSVDINDEAYGPSYNFVVFGQQVQSLGLTGLYGCLSVFVVSRKGAWMGHFWESQFFGTDPDGESFKTNVLDALDVGVPVDERVQYINQYTIDDLRNKDDKGALGHLFDDENHPHVFLLYPRARVPNPDGEGGFDNDENAGADDDIEFPLHFNKIIEKLYAMFPDQDAAMLMSSSYYPMTQEIGHQVDLLDSGFDTHRGKVLIQYQPAHACDRRPRAMWRVFVEGRGKFTKNNTQFGTERCTNNESRYSRHVPRRVATREQPAGTNSKSDFEWRRFMPRNVYLQSKHLR